MLTMANLIRKTFYFVYKQLNVTAFVCHILFMHDKHDNAILMVSMRSPTVAGFSGCTMEFDNVSLKTP